MTVILLYSNSVRYGTVRATSYGTVPYGTGTRLDILSEWVLFRLTTYKTFLSPPYGTGTVVLNVLVESRFCDTATSRVKDH